MAGESHNQIQQQLNLNERTYWRYWKAAFAEDRARLFSTVSTEEVQTQFAIGEARLTDIYRNPHEMGQDTDLDAVDRRQAENMAAEVAVGLLRPYQDGPLKVIYDNNRREQQQLQQEESEEDQRRSSGSQAH